MLRDTNETAEMSSLLHSSEATTTTTAVSGRASLQERLRRRHCNALATFQSSLQALNSAVDQRQQARLVELKRELQAGHRSAEETIQCEQSRIAQHEALLEAQYATLHEADEGTVLPLFVDEFHPALNNNNKRKIDDNDVQNDVNKEEDEEEENDEAAVLEAQMLNKPRIADERRRVAELALSLRQAYDARMRAIESCMHEISAEEQRRGHAIQDELRALMLELAKISYIGVTDAHVLAQRVLHSVNGSMAENYAAYHTLLHQLRQREVLKQQSLNEQLAQIYASTLRRLARSHACAVCTLMRSAYFRRPASRVRGVDAVRRVSLAARTGGKEFLTSLAVMLCTLRVAPSFTEIAQANNYYYSYTLQGNEVERKGEESAMGKQSSTTAITTLYKPSETNEAQREQGTVNDAEAPLPLIRCGGTSTTGWLREYNSSVTAAVFTFLTPASSTMYNSSSSNSTSTRTPMTSSTVVDEWRMKASVVLRHTLGDCLAVVEAIKDNEQRRVHIASQLCDNMPDDIRWIYRPTTEELTRLQGASLAAPKLDSCFSRVLQEGETEADNTNNSQEDNVCEETLSVLQRDAAAMTQRSLDEITKESGWFVQTIESGLRRSHAVLEGSLLTAYESVLRLFEKATEALVQTACRIHGFVRQCHRGLCEARKDHEDDVAREEAHYAALCEKILHAGSHAVAEGLFAEGLRALQRIAALHSQHHRRTRDRIMSIQDEVIANTAEACRELQRRLGVESVLETTERRAAERRARQEALLAEQRLREQQQQQQQSKNAAGRQQQSSEKRKQQQQPLVRSGKGDGSHRERHSSSANAEQREEHEGRSQTQRSNNNSNASRLKKEENGEVNDDDDEENEEGEEEEEEEEEEEINYPQLTVPITGDRLNGVDAITTTTSGSNANGVVEEEVYNLIAPLSLIERIVTTTTATTTTANVLSDVRPINQNSNTTRKAGTTIISNNRPGRQSRQGSVATSHTESESHMRRVSGSSPFDGHHNTSGARHDVDGTNETNNDVEEEQEKEEESSNEFTRVDSMAQLVSVVGELITPEAQLAITTNTTSNSNCNTPEARSLSERPMVAAAVRNTYEPLFRDTLQRAENFITASEIIAWRDALRLELLRWLVALRHACTTGFTAYCTQSLAELETRTNWVLRHHRRRPASFQADFYEVRQRELETKTNAAEKYCARLRERLAGLQERWLRLQHANEGEASDAALLEELNQLATSVSTCASMTALQSHGRRAESLMQRYLDAFQERYRSAMEQLERQYAVMQQECQHYLEVRAKELRSEIAATNTNNGEEDEEGDKEEASAISVTQDLVTQRVQRIQCELQDSLAAMQESFTTEQQRRGQEVEQLKTRYAAAARQRSAELLLLGSLQEIATGVKLQVQSITQRSESEASALDERLKELERILRTELQPAAVVATLRLLTQRDDTQLIQAAGYGSHSKKSEEKSKRNQQGKSHRADSLKRQQKEEDSGDAERVPPSADEFAHELRETAYDELSAGLRECAVELQRSLNAGPAAELLRVLDQLRLELYSRGVKLDALVGSVELVHIVPEEYIMPRSLAHGTSGTSEVTSPSRATATQRNKARPNATTTNTVNTTAGGNESADAAAAAAAAAALLSSYESPRLDPIPPVQRYEAELRQRIAEATSEAQRLLQSFFEAHPAPLTSNTTTTTTTTVAGNNSEATASETGTMAGLMRDFQSTCQAQLTSAKAHITKAQQRYCRQVHRLHKLLPKVPQFLSIAVYALACTAVERRLRGLMQSFAQCYGASAALRAAHQRAVKVSLGARRRAEQLGTLATQEQLRQQSTTEALIHFWTCALCELEDEATRHAVRSFQSSTTLLRLLKGLVGPAHLIECELEPEDTTTSNNKGACGLRELMRRRATATARAAQVRHWQEQQQQRLAHAAATAAASSASHGKRDRRLQETMPLPKVDPAQRAGRTGHGNDNSSTGLTMMRGGGTDINGLPLAPYVEVRCDGLPLHLIRPHEGFNAAYPNYAIEFFVSVALQYFPVNAIVNEAAEALAATIGGGNASSSNNLNTLNYIAATGSTLGPQSTTTTNTAATKNKAKGEETDEDKVVSPPFFISPSALSTDTVDFAVDSVALFNATTEEMVADMNACFATWYTREQEWSATWAMTLERLLNPAGAATTTTAHAAHR